MSGETQLEIDGIGQQLATLEDWKAQNKIFTHRSEYHEVFNGPVWSCWDEIEDPFEFDEKYSFNAMGYGDTEKEAIIDFCINEEIALPFWW